MTQYLTYGELQKQLAAHDAAKRKWKRQKTRGYGLIAGMCSNAWQKKERSDAPQ